MWLLGGRGIQTEGSPSAKVLDYVCRVKEPRGAGRAGAEGGGRREEARSEREGSDHPGTWGPQEGL